MKFLLFFWNFFSLVLMRTVVYHNPVMDPMELVLRSTDTDGSFYCNGQVDLSEQRAKLVASLDKPNLNSPGFSHKTEQVNSTTIRIRIKPNGHIGTNRIHCYWSDNKSFGSIADLIIGGDPGVIILKDRCLAFDRRYVQCTFTAPLIGRAFKNGFPKLFTFVELNRGSSPYHSTPELAEITDDNDLVFRFHPIDRQDFPRKNYMGVNMTLKKFGSSYYKFAIEPLHTTKVSFTIDDVSSRALTINITHNNSGTISPRLCVGHLSRFDKDQSWTVVQDIAATTDLKIPVKDLRPSTGYEICLKCYYELEDDSYKRAICRRTTTLPSLVPPWYLILVAGIGVILIVVGIWTFLQKEQVKNCLGKLRDGRRNHTSTIIDITDAGMQHATQLENRPHFNRYDPEPTTPNLPENRSLIRSETDHDEPSATVPNDEMETGYDLMNEEIIKDMMMDGVISPDTIDLSTPRTA